MGDNLVCGPKDHCDADESKRNMLIELLNKHIGKIQKSIEEKDSKSEDSSLCFESAPEEILESCKLVLAIYSLKQNFVTTHLAHENKKIFEVKGIMLHSVGVPQPMAKVFVETYRDIDQYLLRDISQILIEGLNKSIPITKETNLKKALELKTNEPNLSRSRDNLLEILQKTKKTSENIANEQKDKYGKSFNGVLESYISSGKKEKCKNWETKLNKISTEYKEPIENAMDENIKKKLEKEMEIKIADAKKDLVKWIDKLCRGRKTDCVHAFIDGDIVNGTAGEVSQILPWNYRAGHCGRDKNREAKNRIGEESFNSTHIGIEMCEPGDIKINKDEFIPIMKYKSSTNVEFTDLEKAREIVDATYKSAVKLFASLCLLYNLDPQGTGDVKVKKGNSFVVEEKPIVVISHSEGHGYGKASGHSDPEHIWRQLVKAEEKAGIKPSILYTMDGFRQAVQNEKNYIHNTC